MKVKNEDENKKQQQQQQQPFDGRVQYGISIVL